MIKSLLLSLSLLLFTTITLAQDFHVPENVNLYTKEDYARYEKDIIAAAGWLESTPVLNNDKKRAMVNLFVMDWIMGSPTINIEMRGFVLEVMKKNSQFPVVFMAGYARYVLENNYDKSVLNGYVAGLKSITHLYKLRDGIKRDKKMEKLIEIEDTGKLNEWVQEKLDRRKKS
ncbi:hypothetical protein [Chitinophaga arvensicola]|uniref:Uncharacterized protein n=1 Tax=Chitinophaga arvensicola TaxID=29529 RepID=A0A1I0R306_9BACT|nr:hypothetical protein [Chitinophaga arvensicola]SEW34870.1 hypothetical protein SAMN04488122_2158 [Chitinophaga arvensicola]